MARQIDLDNLTDADLAYLAQRTWLLDEAIHLGYEDLPQRIAALNIADLQGVRFEDQEEEVELESTEEIEYADASVGELRQECRDRGLPSTGTKAELVARLEADDEEYDEDEEEDEDGSEEE